MKEPFCLLNTKTLDIDINFKISIDIKPLSIILTPDQAELCLIVFKISKFPSHVTPEHSNSTQHHSTSSRPPPAAAHRGAGGRRARPRGARPNQTKPNALETVLLRMSPPQSSAEPRVESGPTDAPRGGNRTGSRTSDTGRGRAWRARA